jgi:hypothetical protein
MKWTYCLASSEDIWEFIYNKKWEAKPLTFPSTTQEDIAAYLDMMGQEGWELVSVSKWYWYLKRPYNAS